MKEFWEEDGQPVDLERLVRLFVPSERFQGIHPEVPIPCHDVAIEYHGGILLVRRKQFPLKDQLCVIGGGVRRGVPIEESLRMKVRDETGLSLSDIAYLGQTRTFWQTDPFGHGYGTDNPNALFYARGQGELNLDALHEEPVIVDKEKYLGMRAQLHPFVQYILDLAFPLVGRTFVPQGIDGVIFEHRGVADENPRRTLLTAMNGDFPNFHVRQVKIALLKQDLPLGGHSHPYQELFSLVHGRGTFDLKDVRIPDGLQQAYDMERGDALFIPAGVAHQARLSSDAVLLGLTDMPYLDPRVNDIPYKF
jgi:mannose-6-phosphate isomerase-like protein (cupin superfamily)